MATKLAQDLIKALNRISKYGKSEISIDTYIRYLCINRDSMRTLNKHLAAAELLSRLAPPSKEDEWYTAGLLYDICDFALPDYELQPGIMRALLIKSNISWDVIEAVTSRNVQMHMTPNSALKAALVIAETHINDNGELATTEECCGNGPGSRCMECMYSRFYLSETGENERIESVIRKMRNDLSTAEKEGSHVSKSKGQLEQRRVEKGSKASNAVYAG